LTTSGVIKNMVWLEHCDSLKNKPGTSNLT